jgi:hypothetical protein
VIEIVAQSSEIYFDEVHRDHKLFQEGKFFGVYNFGISKWYIVYQKLFRLCLDPEYALNTILHLLRIGSDFIDILSQLEDVLLIDISCLQ